MDSFEDFNADEPGIPPGSPGAASVEMKLIVNPTMLYGDIVTECANRLMNDRWRESDLQQRIVADIWAKVQARLEEVLSVAVESVVEGIVTDKLETALRAEAKAIKERLLAEARQAVAALMANARI